MDHQAENMYGEELGSGDEEIVASSEKIGEKDTTCLETVSEEQAYKNIAGGSLLERSMQALCLMHKLDPDSCLRVDLN